VSGLLLRLHGSPTAATIASIVVAAVAMMIAAMAYRRGQAVLALAIVGLASAAASPFSWSHHWVWFAPLVVHLGYRGYVVGSRAAAASMWLLCTLLGGWIVFTAGDTPQAGLLSLRPGGVWTQILPGTYVLVLVVTMLGSVVWLWRLRDDANLSRSPAHDLEHFEGVDAGHH
jgi:alpha-1,2-mannosyltransferase